MTQYNDRVQKQRDLLKAEEWAKQVKSIHAHSISSMFYDTRPQDTEDGKSVMDIQYNSGLVERKTHDGYTVYFGTELKGDALLDEYLRHV